jgi:YegS/Rv2252/BmrU family lipid kinase
MQNKWFAVVNPSSGGGKSRRKLPHIFQLLRSGSIPFCAAMTEGRAHAMSLTQDALRAGYRRFLCIGGDGTMNEIINGIFSQNEISPLECSFSMLAVGMGRDWIKTVGIPHTMDDAVRAIRRGKTLLQDIGAVTYFQEDQKRKRYFANVAGIGYDAFVTQSANTLKEHGRSGTIPYLMSLFACLVRYQHRRVHLKVDTKKREADVFSMNVGICRYSGGGMKQVPDAIPDDGLFDVTFIKDVTKLDVLRNVKNLYDGSFIKHPKIETFRGKEITIHSCPRIALEVDGESLGHSPFHFTILPKSLKVIGIQ